MIFLSKLLIKLKGKTTTNWFIELGEPWLLLMHSQVVIAEQGEIMNHVRTYNPHVRPNWGDDSRNHRDEARRLENKLSENSFLFVGRIIIFCFIFFQIHILFLYELDFIQTSSQPHTCCWFSRAVIPAGSVQLHHLLWSTLIGIFLFRIYIRHLTKFFVRALFPGVAKHTILLILFFQQIMSILNWVLLLGLFLLRKGGGKLCGLASKHVCFCCNFKFSKRSFLDLGLLTWRLFFVYRWQ